MDRTGSVEQGKQEDLVVVEGDPSPSPVETRMVLKEEVGYSPAPMIEDVEEEVGMR